MNNIKHWDLPKTPSYLNIEGKITFLARSKVSYMKSYIFGYMYFNLVHNISPLLLKGEDYATNRQHRL